MFRFVRTFSLICLCVFASVSYGWISPGDGRLYTMDTSTVKPSTDITNFTSDVNWDGINHFYLVQDTLIVRNLTAPDTLTISPGTVVRFAAGMDIKIDIFGVLMAVGTAEDTIVFTSDASVPDTADWNDIRFLDASIDSLCQLSYCRVEYTRWGIGCRAASPTISHCTISNNRLMGLLCVEDASPLFSDNVVENTSEYGIYCSAKSSPTLRGNIISNNYFRGISCHDSSSPLIELNNIYGSIWEGIRCENHAYPTIVGNTITNNLWGIAVLDSANPFVGGSLANANDIYGNSEWELYTSTHNITLAKYNYWGTVDRDSIEARIHDFETGYTLYSPWTNASHDSVYSSPPVADAGGSYSGEEGSAVSFDGSSSTDDGAIVLYEWDFDGDGVYDSTGASVSYTWDDDYIGIVILMVTDDGALTDEDTASVSVQNVPPAVDAGGPYSGSVNQGVQLSGSATDPGLDTHTYEWDLDGDGEYDDTTGENPTHVWELSGDYTIYLRVADDDGGIGTDSAAVTIVNQPPVADAGGSYSGEEGSAVSFDGSNSTDDGTIILYEWDFDGDGVYDSTGAGISYTWDDDHSGEVILRVTDNESLVDEDTASVSVQNVPPAVDAGGPYSGSVNQGVQLSGSATDPGLDTHTYEWDLDGDGEYDDTTGENPTHVWELSGDYTIYLRVADDDGGIGTDSAAVTISGDHFVRADVNADSIVTLGDAIYLLRHIYIPGSPPPPCMKAADADDSGDIGMADAVYLVTYLYVPGSSEPPLPFPNCGADETPDGLDCSAHPCVTPGHTKSLIGNDRYMMDE